MLETPVSIIHPLTAIRPSGKSLHYLSYLSSNPPATYP
jgi:hypothetical protein